MSEYLSLVYYLETRMHEERISSFFQFCVGELGCSRSGPEGQGLDLFSYSSPETEWEPVRGPDVAIEDAITSISKSEAGTVWLWCDDLDFGIHINLDDPGRPDVPAISFSFNEIYAKERRNENPSLLHELVVKLYKFLSPRYVVGDTYLDESKITESTISEGEIVDVFWVNGFGPTLVSETSRERLLGAPAWRVDELDDGGVFLWAAPLPIAEGRPETTEKLREYFGTVRE